MEQWREANRRRQRQTIRNRGFVPNPPLKYPSIARDGLPLGGGGDGRQVTVSPRGINGR